VNFEQFAEMHGLMIRSLVLDKWVRVPTTDHPKKRNGAYIFDGQSGAVINFALHEKHVIFKSDEPYRPDPQAKVKRERAEKERRDRQERAAGRAAGIIKSSVLGDHPYLAKKGFPEQQGYVWNGSLVLPMRLHGKIVGCQLIGPDGTKRFLAGQATKGASLVMDNKGPDVLVEGFATGLSVRRALKSIRQRYKIHVCFSAGNMLEVAKGMRNPLVIADNDVSGVGQGVAKKISSRIWLGQMGEDFNDAETRMGTAAAAESLRPLFG
jgi:putative DNA primase/helicase